VCSDRVCGAKCKWRLRRSQASRCDLDKKLIDVEENLIQRKLTGQGQDTVRWPPKLISKLNYLANASPALTFRRQRNTGK